MGHLPNSKCVSYLNPKVECVSCVIKESVQHITTE